MNGDQDLTTEVHLCVRVHGDPANEWILRAPGRYIVGRGPNVEIRLDDKRVSRTHGVIDWTEEGWRFADRSTHGTFDSSGGRVEILLIATRTQLRLSAWRSDFVLELIPLTARPAAEPTTAPGLDVGEVNVAIAAQSQRRVLTIGRDPTSDIVIDDLTASRHHAELRRMPNGWEIVDLSSTNGTFVDAARVSGRALRDGSRVKIASRTFVMERGSLVPVDATTLNAIRVQRLAVVTSDGSVILGEVNLDINARSFTAIVGPTGAGKSTLLKALAGLQPPSAGVVTIGERDLYRCYDEVSSEVGYVPQDDIVHPQLTVQQALRYGAELRLSDDTAAAEREQRVQRVLSELGLTEHADKQISRLSGGQRKRASVALELLSHPSVLFLDEPTSGLDPAYERAIMQLLRELADEGRTVVVVTHSVASLELCDQVVFLGTRGWIAFAGRADAALTHFSAKGYPEVFQALERAVPWS